MAAQQPNEEAATAEAAPSWPELDQLVEEVKAKRTAELAAQEAQRNATLKASQDAEHAWSNLAASRCLDDMAGRLKPLGVTARSIEALPGTHSASLELSRLPKGETAVIRVDTTASRNGPRTTVQVQRGNQQLPATIIGTNSNVELRRTLVDVAQKLLA
jgi:hypothetical protein